MPQGEGMAQAASDYFVAEAGEYLDKLVHLLAGNGAPDADRLFRLARGVRGSAEMAQADKIAAVAARLEAAGRSLRDGRIVWGAPIRELATRTVEDLRILVGSVRAWGPAEEARVRESLQRWQGPREGGSAGPPAAAPVSPPPRQSLRPAAAPGAGAEPAVVPVESLFYDDEGPHILNGHGAGDIVPIEALLFGGEDALRKALSLRPEVERLVRQTGADHAGLLERLEEVFDLLRLGLPPAQPGAGR